MPKTVATNRISRHQFLGAALVALATVAAPGVTYAQAAAPELIVYNAKIVTVDNAFSIARAAAVRDGVFTAVGSDKDVLATAGARTVRIDMQGKTILPGFTDTHVHVANARSFPTSVDLTQVRSIGEMKHAIAAGASRKKPGEWVTVSRGWWSFNLAENRNPTKADLDAAAPNNPVTLQVTHFTISNSAALKAAGITRDTPNPPGGEIEKDPVTGEPNGILWDKASGLVTKLIPRPTLEEGAIGIRAELRRMNAHGITSIREMSGTPADADVFRKLYRDGHLTMRVDFCYNMSPLLSPTALDAALKALGPPGHNLGKGMYRSDCLSEVNVDGATGQTALTRADYLGKPGYRGIEMVPPEQYTRFSAAVARHNWRLAVHSSGDAGIDLALNAFEKVGVNGRRWSLEHANTMRPDQYERVKNLGLLVNSQYAHLSEGGKKTLDGWGQEMSDKTQRFKDWLANGIEFGAGSDGPISYKAEPLFWMYGMVTRKTDWGGSIGPDQGITREQAVRSFTSIAARNSFEEKIKGSIEVGKYADFVVLSADILTAPIETVKTTKVLATVLGGATVHGDLAAAAR